MHGRLRPDLFTIVTPANNLDVTSAGGRCPFILMRPDFCVNEVWIPASAGMTNRDDSVRDVRTERLRIT